MTRSVQRYHVAISSAISFTQGIDRQPDWRDARLDALLSGLRAKQDNMEHDMQDDPIFAVVVVGSRARSVVQGMP